jgi:hypothetical protein
MPSLTPTGFETYIYDHKQYTQLAFAGWDNPRGDSPDTRQHLGELHNPANLPSPESDNDSGPFVMVEPSYATGSNDVFLMFRNGHTMVLTRSMAEQLGNALIKVCKKPINCTK